MDRRKAQRIPLDVPCLVTLTLNNSEGMYLTMLLDVSTGGVHLVLPPDESDMPAMNSRTTLSNVTGELQDALEGAQGSVVWVASRHCGIQLDIPLDFSHDELMALSPL